MKPRLERLTEGQRLLWPDLASTPPAFTLYGGIAINLRFGHRVSADFDFLSPQPFDPQALYAAVPYLKGSQILQMDRNTLTCSVFREEPVKLSFFGVPGLGQAQAPEVVEGTGISVASLLDLAGTKASVIQKRAAGRDYLDLHVLMTRGKIPLLDALAAARLVYGPMFNPQITLKALSYYDDGDLDTVPQAVRRRLVAAVKSIDLEAVAARMRELEAPR